ncbi:MAG TPA: hypothetical protein VFM51_05330 [Solirubrobacterales bacterium]|nr:hypothetical protein [Solirubrobacterales bacterium]
MLALVAAMGALGATVAQAELTERGDLFVRFDGDLNPEALPRHARAPISVYVSGTVKTLSGKRPPAMRQITIAINRGGTLDTRGLPVCRRQQLEAKDRRQALSACGSALVGRGRYVAALALPDQKTVWAKGRLLAFNAVVDGRRAIFAHVYDDEPVPVSRVFVFRIRHTRGTFGTVFTGHFPASLNRHGYIRQISLNLRRTYVYRGRRHSYLGAECAAPAGFSVGIFPFARVGMAFEDGRRLASTLIRTCKVRD